jgi:hypothetical protein
MSENKGQPAGKPQWEWQDYHLEAFLDTNPLNLVGRIAAAEKAIFFASEVLRASSGGEVERQTLAEALSGLSILKRDIKSPIGIKDRTKA